MIGAAHITMADVFASNGVMHLIDKVFIAKNVALNSFSKTLEYGTYF